MSELAQKWRAAWPEALAAWSAFTKLHPPILCERHEDALAEGLSDSFAMIRLVDHSIVIDLHKVRDYELQDFAVEILAHEIGHHVYVPANLTDNARLMAIMRNALFPVADFAGMIANLYADLLLNDRLQRGVGLDMAGVYQKIVAHNGFPEDPLGQLYLRSYEILWELAPGTLVAPGLAEHINLDAALAARLVRAYSKDWLAGAGRFGVLCLEYLVDMEDLERAVQSVAGAWLDTLAAGQSGEVPDGLSAISASEDDLCHPREDPRLNGRSFDPQAADKSAGRAQDDGEDRPKNHDNYRGPADYIELMESLGVEVEPRDLLIQYYRELARPHLVRFPAPRLPDATEPVLEGVDPWELGSPISRIDWLQSLIQSPRPIPGVTTVERSYGLAPGSQVERRPLNLYLGVDCSGSMADPLYQRSYPVVAGAVMILSALRAGARVMTALSGEPGEFMESGGFNRNEREHLGVLTSYLGTGYSFGAARLKTAFVDQAPLKEPCHIVLITDMDIFWMLDEFPRGWEIARQALESAGGGATCVLDIPTSMLQEPEVQRLAEIGWELYTVQDEAGLISFAREFSRRHFEAHERA